ncbi:hypothetical protein FEK33_14350 [Nocardia asteroides NBRC 15531]|nr:hypothetical protein FEK33_14350 [Nocardia asteroides NBRC 15531]
MVLRRRERRVGRQALRSGLFGRRLRLGFIAGVRSVALVAATVALIAVAVALIAVTVARVRIPVVALVAVAVALIPVATTGVLVAVVALVAATIALVAVTAAGVLVPVAVLVAAIALVAATVALVAATVALVAVTVAWVLVAVVALVPAVTAVPDAVSVVAATMAVATAIAVVSWTRDESDFGTVRRVAAGGFADAISVHDADLVDARGRLSDAVPEQPEHARGPCHHDCSSHPPDCHAPAVPSSVVPLTPLRSDPTPVALRAATPGYRGAHPRTRPRTA